MDNVVLYYRQYEDEEGKPLETFTIIDDRNIDKPTLALRRLELMKQKVKLKKLGRAMFFLADFIKIATRTTWFIDSNGKVFQYKKATSSKLIFKKIKNIFPMPAGGAIIEVEGIPSRFKTLYLPPLENTYAGLLKHGMAYILYGTYSDQHKNTRRMI